MLDVRVPPHGRPGGAAGVSVGQGLAVESPEHGGQAPVEAQHPVQVEGEHLEPVVGAFDQGAAAGQAALAVAPCTSGGS